MANKKKLTKNRKARLEEKSVLARAEGASATEALVKGYVLFDYRASADCDGIGTETH